MNFIGMLQAVETQVSLVRVCPVPSNIDTPSTISHFANPGPPTPSGIAGGFISGLWHDHAAIYLYPPSSFDKL